MTSSSPLHWRTSLPAFLLVAGVALSCSTACITSALVQSAAASSAAARREADAKRERDVEDELERQSIVQALTPLLTRSDSVGQAERLRVGGGSRVFSVVVVGDYAPQDA